VLSVHQSLLINILGHTAGALIFAIFLVLLYSGGWSGNRGRFLSGLAAGLSVVWNLGSLLVLAAPQMPPETTAFLVAVSFSAFSTLPAVLLHLSIENRRLIGAGYILSGIAFGMHFAEIDGGGAELHHRALLLITIGFLLLAAIAVLQVAFRKDAIGGGTRVLGSMCLALFATSFVHFGASHASDAWSSELIVHHAGIPLALFVLLQDYRFVLLDAFVRFLANALLAAILTGLAVFLAFRLAPAGAVAWEPDREAFLLIASCLFLVLFAWLRNQIQAWLTNAVFRPGDVSGLAERMKDCQEVSSAEAYVDWAAATIAAAVKTNDYKLVDEAQAGITPELHRPVLAESFGDSPVRRQWPWAEVFVPVKCGPGKQKMLLLGRRRGGRRYLSKDLEALANTGAEIAERVESFHQQEMTRLVSQAELRALQSQINPHFLFNALNTLFGTIPRQAGEARRMVLNLADIFRYSLQSDKTFVPLAEEMKIVRAYLEIEQLRLGPRLDVRIAIDEAALQVLIPVLSVQPLVENAVKHGIAPRSEPGYVQIQGQLRGGQLQVSVENSSLGDRPYASGAGVGLQNVRRRLEICYGPEAGLRLDPGGQKMIAELCIPEARSHAAAE